MLEGRHQSATIAFEGDVLKTGQKLLIAKCVQYSRKKSIIFIDNTIALEGLDRFCKNVGKTCAKAGKNLATNVMKNLTRAVEIREEIVVRQYLKTIKQLYLLYQVL